MCRSRRRKSAPPRHLVRAKECSAVPSRVIATCFALVSFAAALLVGMAAGNSAATIIVRATVLLIVAWCVGRIVGAIAQRTVDEHVEQYKQQHPIETDDEDQPNPSEDGPAADAQGEAIGMT